MLDLMLDIRLVIQQKQESQNMVDTTKGKQFEPVHFWTFWSTCQIFLAYIYNKYPNIFKQEKQYE